MTQPPKNSSATASPSTDYVDQILQQWKRERPDIDPSTMGTIGRLSRAAHILGKELEDKFAELGLPGGRFDVLAALRRAGPPHCLSPTALYNSLLISSGAMTNRVDRLTENGLVERLPDPHDRRGLLVQLTPKGLAAIDDAVEAHLDNERRLIAHLDETEVTALTPLLRKLLVGLGDRPHAVNAVNDVNS